MPSFPRSGLPSNNLRAISRQRLHSSHIPSGCLSHFPPSHGKTSAFVWRSLLRTFNEIVLSLNQSVTYCLASLTFSCQKVLCPRGDDRCLRGLFPLPRSQSPTCSTPLSVSIFQTQSYPICLVRPISSFDHPVTDPPQCPHSVPRIVPSSTCLLKSVSTFEFRSPIVFRWDSLEQRKHLERIEICNSILEIDGKSSI